MNYSYQCTNYKDLVALKCIWPAVRELLRVLWQQSSSKKDATTTGALKKHSASFKHLQMMNKFAKITLKPPPLYKSVGPKCSLSDNRHHRQMNCHRVWLLLTLYHSLMVQMVWFINGSPLKPSTGFFFLLWISLRSWVDFSPSVLTVLGSRECIFCRSDGYKSDWLCSRLSWILLLMSRRPRAIC